VDLQSKPSSDGKPPFLKSPSDIFIILGGKNFFLYVLISEVYSEYNGKFIWSMAERGEGLNEQN